MRCCIALLFRFVCTPFNFYGSLCLRYFIAFSFPFSLFASFSRFSLPIFLVLSFLVSSFACVSLSLALSVSFCSVCLSLARKIHQSLIKYYSPLIRSVHFYVISSFTRSSILLEMETKWSGALPWLCDLDHQPTSAEIAGLKRYFRRYPEQPAKQMEYGYLPLHWAVCGQSSKLSAPVVTLLLTAYPRGAQQKTNAGSLPLHLAARYQTGEHGIQVVKSLLGTQNQGVQEKDNNGNLPLHLAAWKQSGEHGAAIIMLLLTAYPKGIQEKSNNGSLPADIAQGNSNLPDSSKLMLREAAKAMLQESTYPPKRKSR